MGLRFRKSIKILPGITINISPSGFSTTVGGKGASYNINHRSKSKQPSSDPNAPTSKGCLWLVGLLLLLVLAFFVWVLNVGSGRVAYRYPVLVQADGVNVRQMPNTDTYSKVLGSVKRGDTLEFVGLDEGGWCRVKSLSPESPFNNQVYVYMRQQYLSIPDSTLAAAKLTQTLY